MTVGPVDVYIVGFRTDRPGPEVVAAVRDVVNQGLVRILDMPHLRPPPRLLRRLSRPVETTCSPSSRSWGSCASRVCSPTRSSLPPRPSCSSNENPP
jgi:Family of unknown function (DUF6325)